MTETQRIADQMRRAFEGDAWHGPAVRQIREGIAPEQALARPLGGTHTICELVRHMAAWKTAVADWIDGSTRDVSDAENFPAQADWAMALEELERAQARILGAVSGLGDERLEERLSNRPCSVYVALHGLVQHDVYHAGQIQMLKRAAAG